MCEHPLEVQKTRSELWKKQNSERTINERCERSYGNIGKIIDAVSVLRVFKCYCEKKKFRHGAWKITVVKVNNSEGLTDNH